MNAATTDDHAKPWETVRRGLLLLMSSPGGAGKTSLSRRLVADYADMVLSISATTRPARPGEEEGREYYFKTREAFEALIQAGELLEWATVFDNVYLPLRLARRNRMRTLGVGPAIAFSSEVDTGSHKENA